MAPRTVLRVPGTGQHYVELLVVPRTKNNRDIVSFGIVGEEMSPGSIEPMGTNAILFGKINSLLNSVKKACK